MFYPPSPAETLVVSNTPGALQRDWKVPALFPLCPPTSVEPPLTTYFDGLYIGDIAVITPYGQTTIGDTAMTINGIFILGEHGDDAIKPWSLTQITFEDGHFVHASHGMFFTLEGAEKEFILAQGLQWDGEDTFDDLCR